MSKLAPTLIVGLGGRGSEIVAKVSEMITDPKQRERINFVVFDTDVNELNQIKKRYPNVRYTVQTSTNMTVGDYLHLDKHTRDKTFPVNPNLYRKTLTEGAGQVRAISHLAFVTAMKRGGMQELDKAIYDLYKLESEPSTQALRVIIVSTLAGGTGSGIILPVAMYIKQFLKTKIQVPGSITRGFFILPEILYDAVSAEPMRYAFKANAYAVLRELNAFILKADGNLPERYKNKVRLEFPKIGTEEFEEYDVLPMDFCFMFDAQNIEGKKLNSTQQYLEHAATCIYAQSIGPMNARSNSSEDNVIRTLVSGQSRNRYAGAGASELSYPSEHILTYIAQKWAVQTVSDQWTLFDQDFKKKSKDNNRARLKGRNLPAIDRGDTYIKTVIASSERSDEFANLTRYSSSVFDNDGLTELGQKWNDYLDAIESWIQGFTKIGQAQIDTSYQQAVDDVAELRADGKKIDTSNFHKAFNSLRICKEQVARRVGEIGRFAADELFKSDNDKDAAFGEHATQIEKHMQDKEGKFLHPNAVRYFLYQTAQALKVKLAKENKEKKKFEDEFKSFEALNRNEEGGESLKDFTDKVDNAGLLDGVMNKHEEKRKDFIDEFDRILMTIDAYRVTAPKATVIEAAVSYIDNLSKAFERFYDSFDTNVSDLQRQIDASREKYSLKKGNAIRYVCASEKCLDKFYDKMEFTGNALSIPDDLCRKIYSEVKRSQSSNTGTGFKDIFDKDIVEYFKKAVMETYSADIKMDIIRALELEAEYEAEIKERDRITDYVKKVIDDTKKLADPFINRPIGEQPVVIPACAYNKNLITDDPARKDLVFSSLNSFGGKGFDDDEIDMETILFYSAIYGLFPDDLLKFAPPQEGKTAKLEAGEYRKAYTDMRDRIGPNPLTTKVITPHLDKNWHLISEMPELNDELQIEQERRIFKALVLGILYKCIRYEGSIDGKNKYSLWLKDSGKDTPLEAQGGRPCHKFYQVVDALTSNPEIVTKILDAIDKEIKTAREDNVLEFESSKLYEGINGLTLPELTGDSRKISIFGIAAVFKATTPPDDFILDQGLMLLESTFELLHEQVKILCHENERNGKYLELIQNQLNLFIGNFDFYRERHPSVIDDYMRVLLQVVIKTLSDKGFSAAANCVGGLTERLFSADMRNAKKLTKEELAKYLSFSNTQNAVKPVKKEGGQEDE